jgi:hypothetical protein
MIRYCVWSLVNIFRYSPRWGSPLFAPKRSYCVWLLAPKNPPFGGGVGCRYMNAYRFTGVDDNAAPVQPSGATGIFQRSLQSRLGKISVVAHGLEIDTAIQLIE